jgi:hypothetical protein
MDALEMCDFAAWEDLMMLRHFVKAHAALQFKHL